METVSRNVIDKWTFTIFSGLVLLIQSISALDVEVGQEAVLQCALSGDYPEWTGPSNLATPLTNGSVINEAGIEWSNNTDLKILNVQTFHAGEYNCSDGITEVAVQLNVLSYSVFVDILNTVGEPSAEILKVTDGDALTVTCQVTGGNPAPTVTFRWPENAVGFPDVSNAITSQELVNNTYTVNASVTFTASQLIDNYPLYCTASFADKNGTETSASIYVVFPPLLSAHGVSQYPTWNTKKIQLNCDGSSKPGVTFQWMAGEEYLSNTHFNYQETYACIQDPDKTYLQLCKSNITVNDVRKEDNGVELKCVYVFEGANYTTEDVYTIDLPFPSTEVSVSGNVIAAVGTSNEATVTLNCSSNAGNPAPTPRWYKGNKLGEFINTSEYAVNEMPDEFNGVNVTQTIEVKVDRTMDGSQITCCVEANDVCDSVTLDVSYPPEILAPQLLEYRAYVGDTITIPCIVDSKPVSILTWSKLKETDSTLISNNTNTDVISNTIHLELTNIDKNNSGQYECRAWLESLGPQTAVAKTTELNVLDVPEFPLLLIHFLNDYPRVTITTGDKAPAIPRQFYIQYRKMSGNWLEIWKPFSDTLPGQGETNYQYDFSSFEVQPDTKYEIRVKSVDQFGLAAYSSVQSFTTKGEKVDDDTISNTKFRNAILISVFVTAAVFLIIIFIIVCAIKKGKCHSSSSKSYVM